MLLWGPVCYLIRISSLLADRASSLAMSRNQAVVCQLHRPAVTLAAHHTLCTGSAAMVKLNNCVLKPLMHVGDSVQLLIAAQCKDHLQPLHDDAVWIV